MTGPDFGTTVSTCSSAEVLAVLAVAQESLLAVVVSTALAPSTGPVSPMGQLSAAG